MGIWIDHRKAIIVSASAGLVTTKTVESEVEAHPRYSGFREAGRGEKQYEGRHAESLHHYYDAVIGQLGQPDAVLIFGPGEAKLELKERLRRASTASAQVVEVETADALTEPQVVARVKEHFHVGR
ncbi:MAG: hypothetical protein ABL982_19935 [Vicinamibacterales bacterium]